MRKLSFAVVALSIFALPPKIAHSTSKTSLDLVSPPAAAVRPQPHDPQNQIWGGFATFGRALPAEFERASSMNLQT
jgi:hypothetical protein